MPTENPPEPIILNEPSGESSLLLKRKKGFLKTFGVLFSGWLVGTLLIVAVLVILVASTGLFDTFGEKIASLQN